MCFHKLKSNSLNSCVESQILIKYSFNMSLILGRLLQQQCRMASIQLLSTRTVSGFKMTSTTSQTLNTDFWDKNKQLNRPMSPHLSVYKIQLTSTLSIFHRITGLATSVVLYGGGIGALFCSSLSFPEIVHMIQDNVPQFIILTSKAGIGGSIIYHTLNGIRHLIWDVGYGFQLKHLYLSGYVVVALTAIGTAVIFIRG